MEIVIPAKGKPELSTTAMFPVRSRGRFSVGVWMAAVIAFGLASRKFPFLFPAILGKYPGDALWALMAFFGWAFLKPRATTGRLAFGALATSFLVEFAQLYQAPWIKAVRATTIGHLVLGSTFAWQDLGAYVVGVGAGIVLDRLCFRKGETEALSRTATARGPLPALPRQR